MELGVRWLDISPRPLEPLPIRNYRLSDNPLMRYEYRPNYQPVDPPYDFMHRGYRTNSAGFRDRERSVKKLAGVYRVLLIGDSTLVGNGIRDMDLLFASLLEARLNEVEGTPVEALNMGVGGYHTVQEVALLEDRGLAYAPAPRSTPPVPRCRPRAAGGLGAWTARRRTRDPPAARASRASA